MIGRPKGPMYVAILTRLSVSHASGSFGSLVTVMRLRQLVSAARVGSPNLGGACSFDTHMHLLKINHSGSAIFPPIASDRRPRGASGEREQDHQASHRRDFTLGRSGSPSCTIRSGRPLCDRL